jgi:kynurenine formamidase
MCDDKVMHVVKESARGEGPHPRARPVVDASYRKQSMEQAPVKVTGDRVIDLTHVLDEDFPTYIGVRQFSRRRQRRFDDGGINIDTLTMTEHIGTHIDAPLHFSQDGLSVDEIPIGKLIAPLCVVDIRAKASSDPDAEMTVSDLQGWIDRHGEVPANACVAMLSGWGDRVHTSAFRNADREGKLHFPGIHPEVAHFLLAETTAIGLAVDTLSLDTGFSSTFPTHSAWLPGGGWGLESVANLDLVPARGATIIVGAPKHRNGTGGPARVIALI